MGRGLDMGRLQAASQPVDAPQPAALANAPSFFPAQAYGAAVVEIKLPCGFQVGVPSHDVRTIDAAIAETAGSAEASPY